MKVIAIYNIKGGVGKTATTVNLAYAASRQGHTALVWDLDPQGAASYYFRIKTKVKGGGKALIRGKRDLDDAIRGTDYEQLDLVPADFSYRRMDLLLDNTKKPTNRLRKVIAGVADDYDYVFLDCAPNISLVSESVFRAADVLVVPVIPTPLSANTLKQIVSFFQKQEIDHVRLMPFFSMVDSRRKLHREFMQSLTAKRPEMLQTKIPYASPVEQMGTHRKPVAEFAPRSAAAKAYKSLWEEISTSMI